MRTGITLRCGVNFQLSPPLWLLLESTVFLIKIKKEVYTLVSMKLDSARNRTSWMKHPKYIIFYNKKTPNLLCHNALRHKGKKSLLVFFRQSFRTVFFFVILSWSSYVSCRLRLVCAFLDVIILGQREVTRNRCSMLMKFVKRCAHAKRKKKQSYYVKVSKRHRHFSVWTFNNQPIDVDL